MKSTIIALALGSLAVTGTALAEKPVNARQLNQERRIDAGVRSGKLTHGEAARLKAQQASISRYATQLRAAHGGKLSQYDEHLIHARQDAANAAILKKKDTAVRGKDHLKL